MRRVIHQAIGVLLFLTTHNAHAMTPNTVVATINTGVTPAGIAITPNGKFAYVANNNNYGITGQDTVSVLNLNTLTPETTISDASLNQPYTITINPQGTIAYVTNSSGSTITMISTATNTVAGTITGFDGPSGMVVTANGKTAYVNNYGGPILGSGNGKTVSVVDLTTNAIVGSPITVGLAPAAIALSPKGDFVYTINYVNGNPEMGTMSVIQTSTNTVVNTISGFSGPFGIAITPNGRYAYVTNFGSNNFAPFGTTVSVVDLMNNVIVDTINVGIQPAGIAISPDGRFVYVTNYNTLYAGSNFTNLTAGQGTVSIIDTSTNQVIPPTIAVDQSPANIALSPNGDFAFVTNYTSNVVDVIALQTFTIKAKGCILKDSKKRVVNLLTWTVKGTSMPVSFSIYRDAALTDLVTTVPGNRREYMDECMKPCMTSTYYLVGTNDSGTMSEPVAIKVNKECKKDS